MLVGIHPLLRGEVLAGLDRMGHGDVLVIADANFPARRLGGTVVDLPGVSAPEAAQAIFTVFPVDPAEPVGLMAAPQGRSCVQDELLASVIGSGDDLVQEWDRHDFYQRAGMASLIVQTGEMRPYGNLLVHKDVVPA